jgi:hypothetical protein
MTPKSTQCMLHYLGVRSITRPTATPPAPLGGALRELAAAFIDGTLDVIARRVAEASCNEAVEAEQATVPQAVVPAA